MLLVYLFAFLESAVEVVHDASVVWWKHRRHISLPLPACPLLATPDTTTHVCCTQIVSQDTLRESEEARTQLRAALSSSSSSSSPTSPPLLFGIGVTDPAVAAFLAEATTHLPTALFWDSVPALGAASRVDGFAPGTAGPFARLLAQHVGFSKEARAAAVLTTLTSLWGRHTSGAWWDEIRRA